MLQKCTLSNFSTASTQIFTIYADWLKYLQVHNTPSILYPKSIIFLNYYFNTLYEWKLLAITLNNKSKNITQYKRKYLYNKKYRLSWLKLAHWVQFHIFPHSDGKSAMRKNCFVYPHWIQSLNIIQNLYTLQASF